MSAPSIYVYDCSNAGVIVDSFKQFAEQHEKESEVSILFPNVLSVDFEGDEKLRRKCRFSLANNLTIYPSVWIDSKLQKLYSIGRM